MTKFLSFSPNYKEENKKYSLKYYYLNVLEKYKE